LADLVGETTTGMSLAAPQPQALSVQRVKSSKSGKLILLSIVAVIASLTTILLRPHEPTYLGRGLSSWLLDLEANRVETQATAAEAVKQIGPKAVPFLVRRLGSFRPNRIEQLIHVWTSWIIEHAGMRTAVTKHYDQRLEALAALDALGKDAVDALPALQELMAESPPDPRALYVITRTGNAGFPVVRGAVTSHEKLLRLEAKVCLEMAETHSPLLYGDIGSGPDAATFERRMCLFNAEVIRAAFRAYRDQHPNE
jgi:hypothetical protein